MRKKEFRTTSKEAYINYQDDFQEFGQQSFDHLNSSASHSRNSEKY